MSEDLLLKIRDQLYVDEGVRFKVYKDSVGKLTIGVGRNLEDRGISKSEADFLLNNDIDEVFAFANQTFVWFDLLNDPRKAVILNMLFQLGISGFMQFKNTIHLIEQGKYDQAAAAMLQSKWAIQCPSRSHRLALQMLKGEWSY